MEKEREEQEVVEGGVKVEKGRGKRSMGRMKE